MKTIFTKVIPCMFVLFFVSTITILADSYTISCNRSQRLQNGVASTSCRDTLYEHVYQTYGTANNYNSRIVVYIGNASGTTVDSGSSTSTNRNAVATWSTNKGSNHYHSASSMLWTK